VADKLTCDLYEEYIDAKKSAFPQSSPTSASVNADDHGRALNAYAIAKAEWENACWPVYGWFGTPAKVEISTATSEQQCELFGVALKGLLSAFPKSTPESLKVDAAEYGAALTAYGKYKAEAEESCPAGLAATTTFGSEEVDVTLPGGEDVPIAFVQTTSGACLPLGTVAVTEADCKAYATDNSVPFAEPPAASADIFGNPVAAGWPSTYPSGCIFDKTGAEPGKVLWHEPTAARNNARNRVRKLAPNVFGYNSGGSANSGGSCTVDVFGNCLKTTPGCVCPPPRSPSPPSSPPPPPDYAKGQPCGVDIFGDCDEKGGCTCPTEGDNTVSGPPCESDIFGNCKANDPVGCVCTAKQPPSPSPPPPPSLAGVCTTNVLGACTKEDDCVCPCTAGLVCLCAA
jgi:hypothetical protein